MTAAVIDNTLLSNFAHVQQSKLLEAAFDQPVTVRAVMNELMIGVQTARIPSVDWSWLHIIELTDEERTIADLLNQSFGRGESACIALAKSRH
jgi:predicted nucleic acid-binding protein